MRKIHKTQKMSFQVFLSFANRAFYCYLRLFSLSDINECEGVSCSGNGVCKDLINGFFCDCESGFVGDYCEAGMFCSSDEFFNFVVTDRIFVVPSATTVCY